MGNIETIGAIKLDSTLWQDFGLDDEYYCNNAILDLNVRILDNLIPGIDNDDKSKILLREQESLVLAITATYPSFFFYSCQ